MCNTLAEKIEKQHKRLSVCSLYQIKLNSLIIRIFNTKRGYVFFDV